MPNVWDPATTKPLPKTRELWRTQIPNAPETLVEESLDELASLGAGGASAPAVAPTPAQDDVLARLAAAEAAAADAKVQATAAAEQVAALTEQVEAQKTALLSAQATITKLQAPTPATDAADAIHKRLAALEARPVAAPARTPVPPRAASA